MNDSPFRRIGLCATLVGSVCLGQIGAQEGEAISVTFHEPQTQIANIVAPLEPRVRIQINHVGMMAFGLMVDQRFNLCCGAGAIRTNFKIDNRIIFPNVQKQAGPLPPDRFGKARNGVQSSFVFESIHFTQIIEVVPSKPPAVGQKRALDTTLIRYVIENKDKKPHSVGTRVRMDAMCGNNDGALFAAPTIKPKEILNGVELKDKTLPEYVQILERADLNDPGFVGHFTLKLPSKFITPDRFICTAHGVGDNGWDCPAVQAQGDTDCAIYWSPRDIKPGEKIEMAYGYGKGIASLPESEGRVKIVLGGSFEPGKLFTVQAYVEEPVLGQSLKLELPAGMTLVEGSAIQPAAPAADNLATAMIVWRGRVEKLGEYSLQVHSSNGITETRKVTVARKG